MRKLLAAAVSIASITAAIAFVHVDVMPSIGTYGVSIGTTTTYCSLDVPAGFSCQSGS